MPTTDQRREDNDRRVERMNTWIELAAAAPYDHVRFVFYWIAYEAAYQTFRRTEDSREDWQDREKFHGRLADRDRGRLRSALRSNRADIVSILELRQAHRSFWRQTEVVSSAEEWERRFSKRVDKAVEELDETVHISKETATSRGAFARTMSNTLNNLFESLSVVRHQIVHGGSAGPQSRGRTQVILGASLLQALVPCFRDSIANSDQDWGEPPYPRVGSKADEKCPPPWLSL